MIREQIQVYVRKFNALLSGTEIKFVKVSFVKVLLRGKSKGCFLRLFHPKLKVRPQTLEKNASSATLMKINLSKAWLKVPKLLPPLLMYSRPQFLSSGVVCVTSSYHLVCSSWCTFVVNRLREMLSSLSFSSFSREDHSKLRSSEGSCLLEDSEASFVPCDKDLEPLASQEVASAHESKTALEALSLDGDLRRYVLR